jgi:acyl-CoA thioester hydrolase
MEKTIENYPVVIEQPIVWGEMDAFLHVNNVVYFRYFETVRIAYFEKLDVLDYMNRTGIGPILASTSCRFRIPLSYPDRVSIGSRVTGIEEDRFKMSYVVVSEKHGKTAAEGDGLIVVFNYRENTKAVIPDELRRKIIALEMTKGNVLT